MNGSRALVVGLFSLLLAATAATAALADEPRWSFGSELDLVPFLSEGYSVSAIAGRGHWRGRLVRAELTTPEFATDDAFRDDELEVTAFIVDGFLREDQTGWWFGAGFERWDGEVTEKDSNVSREYQSVILTAGCGYVWRLGRHVSINPWAGVHTPVGGDREIRFPSHVFEIETTPEASLKVGVSF